MNWPKPPKPSSDKIERSRLNRQETVMTATAFEWQPEPTLLTQLTTLAQQQGRSPEAIVTQAVITYLQTQMNANSSKPAPLSLEARRAFLKLPLADRRRLLQAQAETLVPHYQTDPEWQALQTGDLLES
jgi:transcription initiation factor TFIID subunit TAF12